MMIDAILRLKSHGMMRLTEINSLALLDKRGFLTVSNVIIIIIIVIITIIITNISNINNLAELTYKVSLLFAIALKELVLTICMKRS